MYFFKIENFAYGKINERGFSNPHPRKPEYQEKWKLDNKGGWAQFNATIANMDTKSEIHKMTTQKFREQPTKTNYRQTKY